MRARSLPSLHTPADRAAFDMKVLEQLDEQLWSTRGDVASGLGLDGTPQGRRVVGTALGRLVAAERAEKTGVRAWTKYQRTRKKVRR